MCGGRGQRGIVPLIWLGGMYTSTWFGGNITCASGSEGLGFRISNDDITPRPSLCSSLKENHFIDAFVVCVGGRERK